MGVWTQFRIVTVVVVASLGSSSPMVLAAGPAPVATNQGPEWTPASRDEFYSLDQGSRIMPLRWIMALKLPDGNPFMADSLRRYGFLPNEASPAGLPVGFTTAGQPGKETIGMSCAACHTRQIEYAGIAYRIDGGPAIIDFQTFLSDLDSAVERVLNDGAAFADFAGAVLGTTHNPADAAALHQAVSDWHYPYLTLMRNGLPRNPWGPGRADAIGMIFNRLTGLDLGAGKSGVIPENIEFAEAPVRYPFLWNAAKQDRTQWPGFAGNDDWRLQLARNVGQVFGVFAEFHPAVSSPEVIDYLTVNSANFQGLIDLENLMARIGPPRWPWALDKKLADDGEKVFKRECKDCHGSGKDSEPWNTQITPFAELGTDIRELELLERKASPGVLAGASFPFDIEVPLDGTEDTAHRILKNAVVGTIVQYLISVGSPERFDFESANRYLSRVFTLPADSGYEARVLRGVWAAAPYLHNGSVPTLTELLKPPAERTPSFKIGSAYDPVAVGLAREQTQFSAILTTTDCSDRRSGNSRCGHEYGTKLSVTDKKALLEYLKMH